MIWIALAAYLAIGAMAAGFSRAQNIGAGFIIILFWWLVPFWLLGELIRHHIDK